MLISDATTVAPQVPSTVVTVLPKNVTDLPILPVLAASTPPAPSRPKLIAPANGRVLTLLVTPTPVAATALVTSTVMAQSAVVTSPSSLQPGVPPMMITI